MWSTEQGRSGWIRREVEEEIDDKQCKLIRIQVEMVSKNKTDSSRCIGPKPRSSQFLPWNQEQILSKKKTAMNMETPLPLNPLYGTLPMHDQLTFHFDWWDFCIFFLSLFLSCLIFLWFSSFPSISIFILLFIHK